MGMKKFFHSKGVRITGKIFLWGFAVFGFGVFAAWGIYSLGLTNNRGLVDKNNRYLASVSTLQQSNTKQGQDKFLIDNYLKLITLSKFYPKNAELILEGLRNAKDDKMLGQMIAACELYMQNDEQYTSLYNKGKEIYGNSTSNSNNKNAITWMNAPEWEALKQAILKDRVLIDSAAKITGVEPRLIVGCLVGEQIRLFNSKREMYKKYLGPVKVLSVQSQFSFGVNGIKDFTAQAVEQNLKDLTSPFYMGKRYEHILDYKGGSGDSIRLKRLIDYHNHLYSYIYTGCIIHQTRNQWKRSGYDISNRPEILFTLFNVGFSQSHPSANPECGGSHITVGNKVYTFGAIGFDFYYSGELSNIFPYHKDKFID